MKAKELMVWDWVNLRNGRVLQPRQVTCIGFSTLNRKEIGTSICLDMSDEFPTCIFRMDVVEPILLTAEILEKNGFVANKHVYPYPYYEYINEEDKVKVGIAFPQGNRTLYKEPWVCIGSENVFIEHLPCIFVHQLQQILRLCGITLNIEV